MKKLWIGLGVVLFVLIGAAVAVPFLIDLNDYKGEISARVHQATGRELSIGGDIRLNILPTPRLTVTDVAFANVEGATSPEMARIKSLDVQVALSPLLSGRIQVERIVVIEPVIELARLADGRRNWQITPPGGEPADGGPGGDGAAVRLDSLVIEGGTLIYRDEITGTSLRIDDLNARISADSLAGPFAVEATAKIGGQAISVEASAGKLAEGRSLPLKLSLRMTEAAGGLEFSGTASAPSPTADVKGKLKLRGKDLAAFLAAIAGAAGADMAPPEALAHGFDLATDVTASSTSAVLENVNLRLGESVATGSLQALLGERISVNAKLSVNRINLDKLFAAGSGDAPADETPTVAEDGADAPGITLPAGLDGALELDVGAVTWQGGVVRQVKLSAQMADGVLVLSRAAALLPGGSDVVFTGQAAPVEGKLQFDGNVQAGSDNLRALLDWLKVDAVGQIPADRLRKFHMAAAIQLTAAVAQVNKIDLRLDSMRLTGAAAYALRRRPSFTLDLRLDQLNVDAYLPPEPAAGAAPAAAGEAGGIDAALALLEDFDTNTKLRIKKLTYGGVPLRGLTIDVGLYRGALTIRQLKIAGVAGAAATLQGSVQGLATKPSVKFAASIKAASLVGLARLADVTLPVPPKRLGKLEVKAEVAGDLDRFNLDVTGLAATTEFAVKGQVAALMTAPAFDLSVRLANKSLARIAQLAGLPIRPPKKLDGPVAVTATIAGRLDQALAVDLSGTAAGTLFAVKGNVSRVLTAPTVDLALEAEHKSLARFARQYGLAIKPAKGGNGPLAVTGTIAGGLQAAKLDLTLNLAGLRSKLGGDVALGEAGPSYKLALNLAHRDLVRMARTFGLVFAPAAENLGGLNLNAEIAGDAQQVTVSNLKAKLGPAALAGTITTRLGGRRPHVGATLRANQVLADLFLPVATAGIASATGQGTRQGKRGQRWSSEPIDLSALSALDADLELTAKGVEARGYRFGAPKLVVKLKDGTLDITRLTAKLFDGDVDMTARIKSGSVPTVELRLKLKDGDILKAARATAGIDQVTGRFDIDGTFTASGRSQIQMIRNLNGIANLAARDGMVSGIDIPALSAKLKNLADLADFLQILAISTSGGKTRLIRGQGSWPIEQGIARSTDTVVILDAARATVRGSLDLPRWLMKVTALMQLTEHANAPPFGVALTGPIDSPKRELKTRNLEGFLAQRVGTGVLRRALGGDRDGQSGGGLPLGDKFQPDKLLESLLPGTRKKRR